MLNQSELIEMYKKMFTIRQFDFRVKELLENGSMFGFVHQYILPFIHQKYRKRLFLPLHKEV